MEQKENMSYKERTKERRRLISEIDSIELKLKDWDRKTDEINSEISDYNKKLDEIKEKHDEFKMKIKEIENEFKEKIKEFEKKFEEKIENVEKKPKLKIKNLEKKLKDCITEKNELINNINEIKSIYIRNGIPVPEGKGYEILNGLLGMKRDINLKLTEHLDNDKIRQVLFILFFFILFIYLVIWNELRIFYLEKSFSFQDYDE
jgi:seryl-tRNA synthetase